MQAMKTGAGPGAPPPRPPGEALVPESVPGTGVQAARKVWQLIGWLAQALKRGAARCHVWLYGPVAPVIPIERARSRRRHPGSRPLVSRRPHRRAS